MLLHLLLFRSYQLSPWCTRYSRRLHSIQLSVFLAERDETGKGLPTIWQPSTNTVSSWRPWTVGVYWMRCLPGPNKWVVQLLTELSHKDFNSPDTLPSFLVVTITWPTSPISTLLGPSPSTVHADKGIWISLLLVCKMLFMSFVHTSTPKSASCTGLMSLLCLWHRSFFFALPAPLYLF